MPSASQVVKELIMNGGLDGLFDVRPLPCSVSRRSMAITWFWVISLAGVWANADQAPSTCGLKMPFASRALMRPCVA